MVCLIEWILKRMGKKKKRENEERKLFEECLIGRGREDNDGATYVFSHHAHQKILSKIERKLSGKSLIDI